MNTLLIIAIVIGTFVVSSLINTLIKLRNVKYKLSRLRGPSKKEIEKTIYIILCDGIMRDRYSLKIELENYMNKNINRCKFNEVLNKMAADGKVEEEPASIIKCESIFEPAGMTFYRSRYAEMEWQGFR